MELSFDIRGYLKPYDIIEISNKNFKETFVDSFEIGSRRKDLYKNYNQYMEDLSKLLSYDFFQWIDGSYVSTKKNPNDMDIVTILDYRDYEKHKMTLQQNFTSFKARKKYSVDAYLTANYPESHKNHIFTKSDLFYWKNFFWKNTR